MPIKKFRNLEEMNAAEDSLWHEPGTPALWQAIRRVWSFAARTCPRRFPPGVYKHRSLEDAQRQREIWEEENFQELWRRRGMKPEDVGRM
jgi:hypothetical protein